MLESSSILQSVKFSFLFNLRGFKLAYYFPKELQKELKAVIILLVSNVQNVVQNLTGQSLGNLIAEIPLCKPDLNILSFNITIGPTKTK